MKKRIIAMIAIGCMALSLQGQSAPKDIDPAALSALDTMGSYLRSLNGFRVKATDTIDLVSEDGQKIQYAAKVDLQVRRPDGVRADIAFDEGERQLYYNGKEFTLFAPDLGYYATVPAKPTIAEVLANVESKYGIVFPLEDLFYWGKDPDVNKDIESAAWYGTSMIGDQLTDHYAFRQKGLDWQVWVTRGDIRLPLKYVITTTEIPEQPQYSVELEWNTDTPPDDAAFTFTPIEDNYSIVLISIDETQISE